MDIEPMRPEDAELTDILKSWAVLLREDAKFCKKLLERVDASERIDVDLRLAMNPGTSEIPAFPTISIGVHWRDGRFESGCEGFTYRLGFTETEV